MVEMLFIRSHLNNIIEYMSEVLKWKSVNYAVKKKLNTFLMTDDYVATAIDVKKSWRTQKNPYLA